MRVLATQTIHFGFPIAKVTLVRFSANLPLILGRTLFNGITRGGKAGGPPLPTQYPFYLPRRSKNAQINGLIDLTTPPPPKGADGKKERRFIMFISADSVHNM